MQLLARELVGTYHSCNLRTAPLVVCSYTIGVFVTMLDTDIGSYAGGVFYVNSCSELTNPDVYADQPFTQYNEIHNDTTINAYTVGPFMTCVMLPLPSATAQMTVSDCRHTCSKLRTSLCTNKQHSSRWTSPSIACGMELSSWTRFGHRRVNTLIL